MDRSIDLTYDPDKEFCKVLRLRNEPDSPEYQAADRLESLLSERGVMVEALERIKVQPNESWTANVMTFPVGWEECKRIASDALAAVSGRRSTDGD